MPIIEDLIEEYNHLFCKLVNIDDKAQERHITLRKEIDKLYFKIIKKMGRLEKIIDELYIGDKSNAENVLLHRMQ